jgi:hypothetical protein
MMWRYSRQSMFAHRHRRLRNNTWIAYTGSGTGQGSGWDYLTVTQDGSYSFDNSARDRFSTEARDYIIPVSFSYVLGDAERGHSTYCLK